MSAPYYIHAPPLVATSAGIRVLYKLADALNRRGHEAWIALEPYLPELLGTPASLQAPLLTREVVERHQRERRPPIALYPEVVVGNPLKATAVVRYVMNTPGLLGGPASFPGELVFAYGRILAREVGLPDRNLFLPAVDIADFPESDDGPRPLVLFYAAKFRAVHHERPFNVPEGAIEITRDLPGSQTTEEVRALLRQADRIYLFENSALAIEAPLSGCVAIMMPNAHLPYAIGAEDHGLGGIAWGDDPAEIARARATLGEMRVQYAEAGARFPAQLERFLELSQAFADKPRAFGVEAGGFRLLRTPYSELASQAAGRMMRGGRLWSLPAKAWTVLRRHGPLTLAKIVGRFAASLVSGR